MRIAPKRVALLAAGVVSCFALIAAGQAAPAQSNPILEHVLQTARTISEPSQRSNALIRAATACAEAGFTQQARSALDEAAAVALESRRPSQLLLQIGRTYLRMGLHEQAGRVAEGIANHKLAVDLLLEIADSHLDASQQQAALDVLGTVLERLEQVESVQTRAGFLAGVAQRYGKLGQVDAATDVFQQAVQTAREIQDVHPVSELLRSLVSTCAELISYGELPEPRDDAAKRRQRNQLQEARRLADTIPEPGQKMGALMELAALYAEAGYEGESADLLDQAETVGQQVPTGRQIRLLSQIASALAAQDRKELALERLNQAERLAERIRDRDERELALQQMAIQYAELDQWGEAARLASKVSDPHSKCKYKADAAIELDALGRPAEALRAIDDLDPRYLKYVGYERLGELARIFHHARPAASLREVNRLRPPSFRDHVLAAFADSAVRAGDYDGALNWARRISADRARARNMLSIAETSLQTAREDQTAAVLDAARRVIELLETDYEKLQLLFRVASKRLRMGDDPGTKDTLQQMEELLEAAKIRETRATALCRIAILLQGLGRQDSALENVQEAVETAEAIGCSSCRDSALITMLQDLLASGHFELLRATLERLQVPRFQATVCLSTLEKEPHLSAEQKVLFLHSALKGATQMPSAFEVVRHLTLVASGYAQADVRPGEPEKEILLTAPRPPERPIARPRPGVPPVEPGGEGAPTIVKLAYFGRPGCPGCKDAKNAMSKAFDRFPDLTISLGLYDMDRSEAAATLNKTICEHLRIPERDHLLAPSVFSVLDGLIGSDITEDRVAQLIQDARGLPGPREEYGQKLDRRKILEAYKSLKPFVVILAGLGDGINPCAFTVIIFFLSYLAYIGKEKRQIIAAGTVFTAAVFIVYFGIGLGLSQLINVGEEWSDLFTKILYGAVAAMTLVAAVLSFLDALRCLKGQTADLTLSLPDKLKSKIRLTISRRARLGLTVGTTAVLGAVVAFFEFPCTGQVYVPIITILHSPDHFWGPAAWLLLYNLCFIVPLIAVFIAVFFGLTSEKLTSVFRRHMAKTKFALAFIFLCLFGVMVLYLV